MNWAENILIKGRGGIYDTTNAPSLDQLNIEEVKKLFDMLRTRLLNDEYLDNISELDLIITNRLDISAFVVSYNKQGAICLSIGLIRAVWNLLLLSLCDPQIFPNYPEDEKINYSFLEKIPKNLLFGPAIIASIGYDAQKHDSAGDIYQNITNSRRELCELLFSCIFDYILYHEVMHITRRHIKLFSILTNENCLQENRVFNGKSNKIYQLLELDADLNALSYSLSSHPEYNEFHKLSEFEKGDFFFGQIFYHVIVQQLFDLQNKDIVTQLLEDHPPPVFRSLLWSNLSRQHFRVKGIISDDLIADEQDKAWYEASHIAVKLGFPSGRWHGDNMNDIPFSNIEDYITEYNSFVDVIERDLLTNDSSEFRKYLKSI